MPSVAASSHFSPVRTYFQKTGLFSAWPDRARSFSTRLPFVLPMVMRPARQAWPVMREEDPARACAAVCAAAFRARLASGDSFGIH
ncbi:hypothetical protein CGZ69_01370 [Streptomyces peucetius subsp. caesius ATCC 27952]|nr:hypothetical protein CGZ69_01370 [Streptomyces peucetius subsp. caesius ATCC 27952]